MVWFSGPHLVMLGGPMFPRFLGGDVVPNRTTQ
jgi:hypothetical protein